MLTNPDPLTNFKNVPMKIQRINSLNEVVSESSNDYT